MHFHSLKLAPEVIFYCNMIITARDKAPEDQDFLPAVRSELKKWKISDSKALECIDQYVEHLSATMKERETLPRSSSDPIYLEHKREKAILTEARKLLAK